MPISRTRLSVRGESYVFGDASTYAKNMEQLFIEEKYCDTRFLVGHRVQAMYGHKCIIAPRCQALSTTLLPNAGELMQSVRSSHILKDVEPEIFRVILRFLYTNSINFESLTTAKLIEVLRAALRFQLQELAKLVENHLVTLIDYNTVYDLLNIAVKFKCGDLTVTTMSFIIKNANDLLTANNSDISILSPLSMQVILKNDDLPVSEITLFHMAAEWAERYIYFEGDEQIICSRKKLSTAYNRTYTSPQKHSIASPKSYSYNPSLVISNRASKKQKARVQKSVFSVMSCIRYGLMKPNELKSLESNPDLKCLIPPKCLADAWRILTFKNSNIPIEEKINLPITPPKRRAYTTEKNQRP